MDIFSAFVLFFIYTEGMTSIYIYDAHTSIIKHIHIIIILEVPNE